MKYFQFREKPSRTFCILLIICLFKFESFCLRDSLWSNPESVKLNPFSSQDLAAKWTCFEALEVNWAGTEDAPCSWLTSVDASYVWQERMLICGLESVAEHLVLSHLWVGWLVLRVSNIFAPSSIQHPASHLRGECWPRDFLRAYFYHKLKFSPGHLVCFPEFWALMWDTKLTWYSPDTKATAGEFASWLYIYKLFDRAVLHHWNFQGNGTLLCSFLLSACRW